jgi:hypothetical protein
MATSVSSSSMDQADLVEAVPVRQRRLSPRERVDVFRLFEIMRGRVAARTSARKKVLGARSPAGSAARSRQCSFRQVLSQKGICRASPHRQSEARVPVRIV